MQNSIQKSLQALHLLKSITEDSPIKLVEHQLAIQSVEVIQESLKELHNIKSGKGKQDEKKSIFTNMEKEEISVVFNSGQYTIPHSGFGRCCFTKKKEQVIPEIEEWTNVSWEGSYYDNDEMGCADECLNSIYIRKDGDYIFVYKLNVELENDVRIFKNDNTEIPCSSISGKVGGISVITPFISLKQGDFLNLQIKSIENKPIKIFPDNTFFACERRY